MSDQDIAARLTKGEPGPMLIEAAQEIRQLRNYTTALREENERLRVMLEEAKKQRKRSAAQVLDTTGLRMWPDGSYFQSGT